MRYLDAAAVRVALSMDDCINAMRIAFGADREAPPRSLVGGSLFMPGRAGAEAGVKVVSIVPGNPAGLVVVVGEDGSPLGIVDGPSLTALRTGAGCGLMTSLLAPLDARVLAMLGAGAMAADQVAAVRRVRPIDEVLVWSRDPARAAALASLIEGRAVADADEAVAGADIVTTATPARSPIFDPAALREGTHVNAIGAFTPDMCELPAGVLADAFVVVDDRGAARMEAGDLLQAGRSPDADATEVLLGARPEPGRTTVFKSVGIASQDIAAAVAALAAADRQRLGLVLS